MAGSGWVRCRRGDSSDGLLSAHVAENLPNGRLTGRSQAHSIWTCACSVTRIGGGSISPSSRIVPTCSPRIPCQPGRYRAQVGTITTSEQSAFRTLHGIRTTPSASHHGPRFGLVTQNSPPERQNRMSVPGSSWPRQNENLSVVKRQFRWVSGRAECHRSGCLAGGRRVGLGPGSDFAEEPVFRCEPVTQATETFLECPARARWSSAAARWASATR